MAKPYRVADFHYRCERCGADDFNPSTSEEMAYSLLSEIAAGADTLRRTTIGGCLLTEKTLHPCKDGGQGISRLVGYRVKTEG